MGNRITSAQTTGDWTYNQNNELETSDNVTYEYDANGNMIRKTVNTVITNYIYNEEDRLTEVRDGSNILIANYYYDPFGRRLWKEVSGVKTCFVYADEGLVGEYDATGTEIKSYGYMPNSTWTTDPLFMKENGTYYFYQNDHLGTPQKLTAINGAVVWRATYESFGKAQVDGTAIVTNNLRFPGQYYDQETGLHYNWNRYYDPSSGRYVTADPMGLYIDETNLYDYVHSNPNMFIDPKGYRKQIPYVPIYKIACFTGAMSRLLYDIHKCKDKYENCDKNELRRCIDERYDIFEFTVEQVCRIKTKEPEPKKPCPDCPGDSGGGGATKPY